MKAEFDIGNIIYVILTIGFLIAGAFGKKKKPVQRVAQEQEEVNEAPVDFKSQFQELLREFNPAADISRVDDYRSDKVSNVEDGPALDVVQEENYESKIDLVPAYEQPIDSNINYNDQAQSSLDTAGMDEGVPDFDYSKDHNSLVYNNLTREYDSVLTFHEEELADIVEGFDPKAAFVYSEIFNRKEF
jgi:hypothetical protein